MNRDLQRCIDKITSDRGGNIMRNRLQRCMDKIALELGEHMLNTQDVTRDEELADLINSYKDNINTLKRARQLLKDFGLDYIQADAEHNDE